MQYVSISVIAIENVFFNQNVSSAISTRQVIGAVSVVGAKHGSRLLALVRRKQRRRSGRVDRRIRHR